MKTRHGTFFAVLAMAAMFAACGNPSGGGGDSVVTALDLTDFVTRPAEGATPVTIINAAQYSGTIVWKEIGSEVMGNFATGKEYEAEVTLTAKSGYTFTGIAADSFTHYSGAKGVTNETGSGTVTVTFSAIKNLLYTGTNGTAETETETLAKVAAWLGSNAETNIGYTIKLNANERLGPTTLSGANLNGKTGVTIMLTTEDTTPRTVQLSQKGSIFTVNSSFKLSLDGSVVIKGRADNNAPLILVNGGTLELKGSAKITGNTSSHDDTGGESGGGVRVKNGGTFTMSGGEISDNHVPNEGGGGVRLGSSSGNNSTFTMTGGTITGNSATHGAGVFVRTGESVTATFNMSNGTISGNTAHTGGNGGGMGGGVFLNGGKDTDVGVDSDGTVNFTMSGGAISGNNAVMGGGVGISKANVNKTGGTISDNIASGVFNGMNMGDLRGDAVVVSNVTQDGMEAYRNAAAGTGVTVTIDWNKTTQQYENKTGFDGQG